DESTAQDWTASYVKNKEEVGTAFPSLGADSVLTGPAQPATLPPATLTVLSDATSNGERTLRLRLTPQRPVRLATLHVDGATAEVRKAMVGGFEVPVERTGPWSFGLVFHAPPADGFEVDLTLRPVGGGPARFRVEDGSDGLDALPGFHPRPADVGVAGSHSS